MVPPQNAAGRISWRPRFSILTLLLLMAVVALVIGWRKSAREHLARIEALSKDNRSLKTRLHALEVKDESKIVGRYIPSMNPLIRRWRVFLPSGRDWQLKIFSGLIPSQGYHINTATNRRNGHLPTTISITDVPKEGTVLELGVYKGSRGWMLVAGDSENSLVGTAVPIADNVAPFVAFDKAWGLTSEMLGFQGKGQVDLPGDRPVDLWRKIWIPRNPKSGHKPGLLVWIEPYVPVD